MLTNTRRWFPSTAAPQLSALGATNAERLVNRLAMAATPWVMRIAGYTVRVGTDAGLAEDGHRVLEAVWRAKGVVIPEDVASYGERYDRATTWLVAYRGHEPVGVMGLLDMRIASVALDYGNLSPPPGLELERTREIGRLAILPRHRGGGQSVMVALTLTMYGYSVEQGMVQLFSGSTPKLFEVYRRFNPTARLIHPPAAGPEDPVKARYFAPLRAYGGPGVVYTFDIVGASPSDVLGRFLSGRLRPQG